MSRRRKGVRLEMTALMDVMFLVLVFFVYCIFDMTARREIGVDLPGASGTAAPGERIVIAVGRDDALCLNGIPVSRDEAVRRVRALRAAGVDLPVSICGDRRASLGAGVELLSALKAAGVDRTSFQVEDAKSASPAAR